MGYSITQIASHCHGNNNNNNNMGGGDGGRLAFQREKDEDRTVVLGGLRLSETVVKRMKDLPESAVKHSSECTSSSISAGGIQRADNKVPKHPGVEEELYRRYEKENAVTEGKMFKVTRGEKLVIDEYLKEEFSKEQVTTNEEWQKVEQLAKHLEKKEAELERLDAFYKEQLAVIEKKKADHFKLTSAQFNEAAMKAHITKRNCEPICRNLQSQILRCYQQNPQLTLNCSFLAKEYRQCINTAQKTGFNHG
uniref:Transmembrane protein, adipocyte asscociated 1 n=1 Tax=Callorhinchus milii TaxID=7868 RepID=A0A4W3JVC7_CALMI